MWVHLFSARVLGSPEWWAVWEDVTQGFSDAKACFLFLISWARLYLERFLVKPKFHPQILDQWFSTVQIYPGIGLLKFPASENAFVTEQETPEPCQVKLNNTPFDHWLC